MKKMTCAQMGGPCQAEMSANSWDEMKAEGMKHVETAHPEMAAKIKATSPTDPMMMKWEADTKAIFEASPEM